MKRRAVLVILLVFLGVQAGGCSALIYMTGRQAVPLETGGEPARTPVYHQGEWIVARAAMHNHTIYSDGARTPEDLLELARREGMAILAYNDHREGDICWKAGLCLPINGIERVGYETYFDHIGRVKESSQDVMVLIGIEAVPYFYNVGKSPNFVVFAENYHFTVYGINDPRVFRDMPARRGFENLKPEPLPGLTPYQNFVDYITDHGGIVHAAHVESSQDDYYGPALFVSAGPTNHVRELSGLTGFSILPEGYHYRAGGPGGGWDSALIDYLVGMRDQVPWAMGDADYHGPDGSLARGTTLFYMREFTEDEVYRCLREGRMVALMGGSFQDSYVSEFSVTAGKAAADPIMFGRTVTLASPPVVRFSLDHEVPDTRSFLIRNGAVVHEAEGSSFEYVDREVFEKNIPAVYRVEVKGPRVEVERREPGSLEPESELFTNPIFVYMAD